jgi:hypothetical protein
MLTSFFVHSVLNSSQMTDATSCQRGSPTDVKQQLSENNLRTESNIRSQVPEWARYLDKLTDWPSFVVWLRLLLNSSSSFHLHYSFAHILQCLNVTGFILLARSHSCQSNLFSNVYTFWRTTIVSCFILVVFMCLYSWPLFVDILSMAYQLLNKHKDKYIIYFWVSLLYCTE